MSDDTSTLSKADRLAIAGQAAPAVRRRAAAPRKVTVVDRDGKPVRVTDDVEIAQAVLARADIEFSVQDGKRRGHSTCSADWKRILAFAESKSLSRDWAARVFVAKYGMDP